MLFILVKYIIAHLIKMVFYFVKTFLPVKVGTLEAVVAPLLTPIALQFFKVKDFAHGGIAVANQKVGKHVGSGVAVLIPWPMIPKSGLSATS